MNIEDNNCNTYTETLIDNYPSHPPRASPPEGIQDHGEQDKLSQQRHNQWGRGNDFRQQQEEDSQREEDGDGEADLFSRVWGQVEHQHRQEGDTHAGDDQVDRVEQGLPPHGDVEGDI